MTTLLSVVCFFAQERGDSVDVARHCMLCPSGKELKALINKQLEGEKEEDTEEGQDDSFSSPEKDVFSKTESRRVPSPVQGEVEPS